MPLSSISHSTYSISGQGKELVAHGTPLFPVAFYHDDLSQEPVPWHWHEELEAMIVSEGETIVSAGKRKIRMHAGQGLFINAGVLHDAHAMTNASCKFHSIVFSPRLIGGGIDSVFWQKYLKPLIQKGPRSIVLDGSCSWHASALADIENAWQEGSADKAGFEFHVRALLSDLIFLVYSHMSANRLQVSEKNLRDGERIKTMLHYINEHYQEQITLEDLCASAMISPSECLRCFRSTIGTPPIQYLKSFRVQKAAELLSSTSTKINEISSLCGFQDPSYFTRSFREIKGMTPNQYRQAAEQA